ncbi:hypothetical protein GR160_13890 [Flavobacterium sp. Sd200]|uniref:tetratricopeptide repeat protein n=1 Tax=Flavobacterium sp. Sd200 TaxID=2692211 RepID=UPI00136C9363|nr:hypothetical protein [Flavobacterium sp. Sd200]MXN92315.1 hypothetical protein [Flavobacterium sp. Sd200]
MQRKITPALILLLFVGIFANAQSGNQSKYQNRLAIAEKKMKASDFKGAHQEYTYAKTIARGAGMNTDRAEKGIKTALDSLTKTKPKPYRSSINIAVKRKITKKVSNNEIFLPPLNDDTIDNPLPRISVSTSGKTIDLSGRFVTYSPILDKVLDDINYLLINESLKNKKQLSGDDILVKNTEERIFNSDYENEAMRLYDSICSIAPLSISAEKDIYIYLTVASHYGRNLLNVKTQFNKADSVATIINKALKIAEQKDFNSAKNKFSDAALEDLISGYYFEIKDTASMYSHAVKAADMARQALALSPANTYYIKGLVYYLRKINKVPGARLKNDEKKKVLDVISSLINYSDIFLGNDAYIVNLKLDGLSGKSNSSNNFINKIKDNKNPNYKNILLTKLYNKINSGKKQNTDKALEYFIKSFQEEIKSQVFLEELQNQYNSLVSNMGSYDVKEKFIAYSTIVKAIEESDKDFINLHNISYIYVNAKSALANLHSSKKTETDELTAIAHLKDAIEVLESTGLLNYYTSYSDHYIQYCKMYYNLLEMSVKAKKYVDAKKYYDGMTKQFIPLLEEFKFDFYLRQTIAKASVRYGDFAFNKNLYRESLGALEFASFEGSKKSTEYLIRVYQNNEDGLRDTMKLKDYYQRIVYQSDIIKRSTVKAEFNNRIDEINVYLISRHPGYLYKGIDDQVEWLRVTKGGIVDKEDVDYFNEMQVTAWENEISLQQVLDENESVPKNQEITTSKYKKEYDKIQDKVNKKDYGTAFNSYKSLNDTFKKDLKNAINNTPAIEDYIVFLTKYGEFLNSDEFKGQNAKKRAAVEIYGSLLTIDPTNQQALIKKTSINYELNKEKPENLTKYNKNIYELFSYLDLYLSDADFKNAKKIRERLLTVENTPYTKYRLAQHYTKYGKLDFKELLKTRKQALEYREYIVMQYIPDNIKSRKNFYEQLVSVDELLTDKEKTKEAKKEFSKDYSQLAWYCMLNDSNNKTLEYINKSIELDPENKDALAYRPHALLLMGEFDKAKDTYLYYKDMPFNKKGLTTFRQVFLSNFKEFEKAHIFNSDIKSIKEFLNQ